MVVPMPTAQPATAATTGRGGRSARAEVHGGGSPPPLRMQAKSPRSLPEVKTSLAGDHHHPHRQVWRRRQPPVMAR
jgi:hypothetical protein